MLDDTDRDVTSPAHVLFTWGVAWIFVSGHNSQSSFGEKYNGPGIARVIVELSWKLLVPCCVVCLFPGKTLFTALFHGIIVPCFLEDPSEGRISYKKSHNSWCKGGIDVWNNLCRAFESFLFLLWCLCTNSNLLLCLLCSLLNKYMTCQGCTWG